MTTEPTVLSRAGALLGTYARQDVVFDRGEGVWLYDEAGRRYLDLLAGIAVCVLGHAHPAVTEAIRTQAGRLLHVSNLFYTPEGIEAAAALAERLGGGKVFFCNSGAEATEAAIKLVRKGAWRRGERGRTEIVAVDGSFHGRTLGALAATMQPAKWEGFEPLPPGFVSVPPDDLEALQRTVTDRTAALFVEAIQGEGGVRPLSGEFLNAARRLCDDRSALLVCDEVQTGMGRTGRWWAFEHAGIRPDVVTVAKGLGSGVPVGAMWVADEHADALGPGDHATTFGGGPLVCAAVLATLHTIEKDGLVDNAAEVGERLRSALGPLGAVRGAGLLLALDLGRPVAKAVVAAALERGLVVGALGEDAIRLAPPLILTPEEADEGVRRLRDAIEAVG